MQLYLHKIKFFNVLWSAISTDGNRWWTGKTPWLDIVSSSLCVCTAWHEGYGVFLFIEIKEKENCLMSMVTSRVEAMFMFSSASYLQGSIWKKLFFRVMNRHCISCCVREVSPVLKKDVLTFLSVSLCVCFHCIATSGQSKTGIFFFLKQHWVIYFSAYSF